MKNYSLTVHLAYKRLQLLGFIILLSWMVNPYQSAAQLLSKNVNIMQLMVEDGLAMSCVDDIICDKQNIIWIKSNRGLQYWDGQYIHTYTDSTLEVGDNFHMHSHPEEGILLSTPGVLKQLKYENLEENIIYKSAKNDFSPIPIFSRESNIILIHKDTVCIKNTAGQYEKTAVQKQTIPLVRDIYKYLINGNYYIVDLYTQKLFEDHSELFEKTFHSPYVDKIRNTVISTSNEIIISQKKGLNIIEKSDDGFYSYPENKEAAYYSALLKIDDQTVIVGVDNLLYEFDIKAKRWTTVYKNIDQNNLLQTGYYDKLIFDNHKNIWAITVNEGLLKIYNNDNFDYYGTDSKNLNFVKNIVADEEQNRIIISALDGGILVYDTLGILLHQFNSQNTGGLVKSVTGIYKIGPNQYIYNNHNDSIIYTLSFMGTDPIFESKMQKKDSYLYYQDAVRVNENLSFLLFNTVYKLIHSPLSLEPIFLYSSTKSCMIKEGNNLWIGCVDGLVKHEIGDANNYNFISLPGEGYVRSISKYNDNNLVIGSDKGLSTLNLKSGELTTFYEGCIYCLLMDDQNNIWTGTGEGIFRFDKNLDKKQYTINDGLQNNEFNTNACVKSLSGKMYFGGVNGITSFDPESILVRNGKPSLFIKSLSIDNVESVKNVSAGKIDQYNLKYDQNNLSFTVGAIGKYESDFYNYQYYVEGVDDKWVDAGQQTKYNFNLSPGKYKFYFSASHSFDSNTTLANPLIVNIALPWWRQWWFYLISFIVITGVITFIIRGNEKQKYLKKKYEWDLEYQRQEDRMKMSKELHDNIGSRLTFLVSSIENIKKLFQSNSDQAIQKIEYLADFGKGTIEDLRSMMWVLTQQTITVQDLQLKILDFLNIAKNTYRNIDFRYEGPHTDLDKKLESKLSQNIFRVVQEGIHNSVKHANPSVVNIKSSIEGENFKISIDDNGIGFDPQTVRLGHGFNNIKSRLREHSSELVIDSQLNKGTTISFVVEIPQ